VGLAGHLPLPGHAGRLRLSGRCHLWALSLPAARLWCSEVGAEEI